MVCAAFGVSATAAVPRLGVTNTKFPANPLPEVFGKVKVTGEALDSLT